MWAGILDPRSSNLRKMVLPSGLPTKSGKDSADLLDWHLEVKEEPVDIKGEDVEEEQAVYDDNEQDEQTGEAEHSDDASPDNIDQHCESVPDSSYVSLTPQFVPSFTMPLNLGVAVRSGRKTIQDKIAEQEKRAAALAQEMREVGIPVDSLPGQEKVIVPRNYSTYASASPSVVKKTVPVSVIRKSPSASAYSFTHEKFSDVRPPVAEPLPVVSIDQPMFASQLNGRVVLVPSVIFRIDGLVSGSADQLYIPQNTYAYNSFIRPRSPTQSLQDDIPLLIKENSPKKCREERLSTKLKRIKDKAGNGGEESPRGFLNQKIAALKRSENALQREYEEVSNMPIDNRTGISSAQNLQRHLAFTNVANNSSHEVLMQMLRGTTRIANDRGSSKAKKRRVS
ncbi:hypothetical protein RvY_07888-2 [Ramazzottius varieornatus]|uniref:Uncharacterized protein n=1 Tax=Ramazzottius varieornatus TaxID=947166 RepID=A0A1D1V8R8_RAMVA|nr:hypothetical protein RvY_07888-2 [Ramazzottius varieornatus]